MRHLLVLWGACAMLCGSRSAEADVSDFDKRAAATLYTTYGGGQPRTWDKMTDADVKGLTRADKSADGTKATYSLDFGARDSSTGGDNRGYLRITKGEALKDAVAEKWEALPKDPATGAQVFHRIRGTDAGKHMQVAVRKQVGQLILTIAQRRPWNEPPAAAAKELTERFALFLASAKQNGLLGGLVKTTRASDGLLITSDQPVKLAIDDAKETPLVLKLDSTDAEGKPVENVEYLTLRLSGAFGDLAKVSYKGEAIKPDDKGRYVLKDPGQTCEVTLTLPAASTDEVQAALFATKNEDGTPLAPLDFVVGGKLK